MAQDASESPRILLGVTGSVAAVKAPELARQLVELGAKVRVVLTVGGANFWHKAADYDPESWERLETILKEQAERGKEASLIVHDADEEWQEWKVIGDTVMHIDLRDWADVLVVAPLSAHSLAKLAHGLCDDTLSCVARAWDFGHGPRPGKPLLLAPAMNTAMYEHPLTKSQVATIQGFWKAGQRLQNGVRVIEPQVKELACGEVGNGALAPVDAIVAAVGAVLDEMAPRIV